MGNQDPEKREWVLGSPKLTNTMTLSQISNWSNQNASNLGAVDNPPECPQSLFPPAMIFLT